MIVDTHSHVFDERFSEDIDGVIDRALLVGVEKILMPNIDVSTIVALQEIAGRFPTVCFPMMGLHPTSVTASWRDDLEAIRSQFEDGYRYVGVGEIGLDLYWDKSLEREQRLVFEEQLRWSVELGLPVSIHSRDAVMECIACIRNVGEKSLRGSFHSFGGTGDELVEVLALENFYVGVNGTVTYKNSRLPDVLSATDLSRLLVETDAPYLPPVPYRGKRNEPSYTHLVVEKLAGIYGVGVEDVEEITTANANKLFDLT